VYIKIYTKERKNYTLSKSLHILNYIKERKNYTLSKSLHILNYTKLQKLDLLFLYRTLSILIIRTINGVC